MTNFDLVEKLRERANVSYEEARAALDATGGDLLEALIYLEKQGRIPPPPNGGSYSSKSEDAASTALKKQPEKNRKGESFDSIIKRFFRWCGEIFNKGNTNYFEVYRKDERIITLPVTVLVLLLVFTFWMTFPLLVVGLFLGCRYAFRGSDIEKMNVNSVMDSAANVADNIKREVETAHQNHQRQHQEWQNSRQQDTEQQNQEDK